MSQIGRLDQQISFERFVEVADGAGGETKSWAPLPANATVWAGVRSVRGSEGFEENRTNAKATVMFTIRQRSDLDERMRIDWSGRKYNVREIKHESPRAQYLRIIAERGVST